MDAAASSPLRADGSSPRDGLVSSSSAPPSGANDGQPVASLSTRDEACRTNNSMGPPSCGTIPTVPGPRSIFADENDGEEEAEVESELFLQVFSVDATAAPVKTTMQPKCIKSRGVGRPPLRARRVLDLMDRLDAGEHLTQSTDSSSLSSESICAQRKRLLSAPMQRNDTAPVDVDEEEQDELVIQRPWKRRPAGEAAAAGVSAGQSTDASEAMLAPPLPRVRPSLGRSFSSHSVFLDRPKLSFEQTGEAGGQLNVSVLQPHKLVLPTIRSSSHPDLNVISPHTVASLIKGEYNDRLDGFTLIDCRFQYEFEGGSLLHALSMNNPAQVEDHFLQRPPKNSTSMALIFYCEFSANRAPKMLRHLRNLDRWIHAERYPELFYPELYLIDGGYKNCFMTLKEVICCQPVCYRPMNDKAFVEHCKRDFATHRANWRQHKSTSCASKFQQLHRRMHDSLAANSDSEDNLCGLDGDHDLLMRPTTLRSFSQQN